MPRPVDYLNTLRNLEIPLDGFIVDSKSDVTPQVTVKRYQNTKIPSTIDLAPKDILLANHWGDSKKPSKIGGVALPTGMERLIYYIHIGVGSSSEIRGVLQLAAYYGHQGKFKPYIDSPKAADIQTQLQDYCDKYIGVCCVGFTTGFAKDSRWSAAYPDAAALDSASFLKSPPAVLKKTIGEIGQEDVMVWIEKAHNAVIDTKTATSDKKAELTTAESLGEGSTLVGPNIDQGTLEHVSGDLFYFYSTTHVTKKNPVKITTLL